MSRCFAANAEKSQSSSQLPPAWLEGCIAQAVSISLLERNGPDKPRINATWAWIHQLAQLDMTSERGKLW